MSTFTIRIHTIFVVSILLIQAAKTQSIDNSELKALFFDLPLHQELDSIISNAKEKKELKWVDRIKSKYLIKNGTSKVDHQKFKFSNYELIGENQLIEGYLIIGLNEYVPVLLQMKIKTNNIDSIHMVKKAIADQILTLCSYVEIDEDEKYQRRTYWFYKSKKSKKPMISLITNYKNEGTIELAYLSNG